jgi:hypothetical protein
MAEIESRSFRDQPFTPDDRPSTSDMTAIGPTNLSAVHLAGSAAGALRNDGRAGEAQAEAAQQKQQVDRLTLSAQILDDVAQSDQSSDRDADGRSDADDGPPLAQPQAREREDAAHTPRRPTDADGDVGGRLDLDA